MLSSNWTKYLVELQNIEMFVMCINTHNVGIWICIPSKYIYHLTPLKKRIYFPSYWFIPSQPKYQCFLPWNFFKMFVTFVSTYVSVSVFSTDKFHKMACSLHIIKSVIRLLPSFFLSISPPNASCYCSFFTSCCSSLLIPTFLYLSSQHGVSWLLLLIS